MKLSADLLMFQLKGFSDDPSRYVLCLLKEKYIAFNDYIGFDYKLSYDIPYRFIVIKEFTSYSNKYGSKLRLLNETFSHQPVTLCDEFYALYQEYLKGKKRSIYV